MKNLLIYIETENNEKFGCFIYSPISIENYDISDQYCFLFKMNENKQILMFPIIDPTKAFKLNQNDQSIEIGEGDIIIRKLEKNYICSCNQHSFNYFGNENVLIQNITN